MEGKNLKTIKRHLPYMRIVPFTRGFYLTGSLARGTQNPRSDIDLIVVSKKNRVWLNRVLLVLTTSFLGRRRSRSKRTGCFCFNLSLDESSINKEKTVNWIDLQKFYRKRALSKTQKIIEFFLEVTLTAPLLEFFSRLLLTKYVKNNLEKLEGSVINLEKERIEYYPPKPSSVI